ncbi:hypothetical protein SAMN04488527_10549 [Aliiroseovarius crassostreae]|uniref:Dihydrodipicolinate reductase n=1 Tax=Aliiroseovarius crassostreae TaxID=154981 RepID=A0A0N8IB62_9RHOB|nr:hypothetical protein [Aliiroseovarius crassostreae]KPN62219.1 hypothetical protein AKJ29_08125 [Aliiroseovarius crassostreae]SFU53232.1 hypothetical protein SAMN04488527_10549 [Aliiroseovarius crassostreae]
MFHKLTGFFAATATLALMTGAAAAEDWSRIQTEEAFKGLAVGPVWHFSSGTQEAFEDGTLTGHVPGYGNFRGTWEWRDEMYCRKIDFYEVDKKGDDCLIIEAQGNEIRITRNLGKGKSYTARLQPKE